MVLEDFTGLVLGDTVPFYLDNVVDLEGNAVRDLASYTVFFTLKRSSLEADDDALVAFESGAGGDITITDDRATWEVPAATTAALKEGRPYHYDIQLKDSDARIFTVRKGTLTFGAQVTVRTS